MRFQHILFPVDFSERSAPAAAHVKAMADRFNAGITLLHVIERPVVYSEVGFVPLFDLNEVEQDAKARLASFEIDHFPGHQVQKLVAQGDPAMVIEDCAKTRGVDLVMLPTRGCGRFRRLLLGSVAAKLLHDLSIPVWTGVHIEEPEHANQTTCQSIMCAVDISPESIRLIRSARELAADCNAVVRLVHAVPGTDVRPQKYFDRELQSYLKEFDRREIAHLQSEAGTHFDVCMEEGAVSDIVRAAALHHSADLVLIGRGAIGHFLGRLRTHSYAIIRDSPCPVLSV